MVKGILKKHLPAAWQEALTHRFVDRFNPGALRRFQRAHRTAPTTDRAQGEWVAIVMSCYNHAAYLDATFESIARQTHRPFEVICVEDHSTDDTLARLRRLGTQLPEGIHPTVVQTPRNHGQAFALNLGVAAARASAIMILNDDDYLRPDALEATLDILRRNDDLFLLGSTSIHWRGSGAPADIRFIREDCADYGTIPLARYTPADVVRIRKPNDLNMTHSGTTFFKSAWRAVGGYYPEKARRVIAYSDRDFQLRVASLFPVAVAQTVPFVYWRSGSSVDHGRNS